MDVILHIPWVKLSPGSTLHKKKDFVLCAGHKTLQIRNIKRTQEQNKLQPLPPCGKIITTRFCQKANKFSNEFTYGKFSPLCKLLARSRP